jgi:glycosyltransferase involved in cell wall biosynthesis
MVFGSGVRSSENHELQSSSAAPGTDDRASDATLVSVLTPSFNQGRFIGDCIASVANQTHTTVEHIVCDGGSTDETLQVLADAPAHVRWLSEPDRGQAHAINKAFSLARGEVIGWLNSDDAYYDRRAIESALDAFTRHPEVDLVYGHAALVGADNEVLHFMWSPRYSGWLFGYANFIVQPLVFIRRSALGERLVDENLDFAVDLELWLRLAHERRRFARLDRIVGIDRHHETRKVYTMEDVGKREIDALYAAFGGSGRLRRKVVPKSFRLLARLRGVGLLRGAGENLAFDLGLAPMATMVRRQVLTRRRDMPLLWGAETPN